MSWESLSPGLVLYSRNGLRYTEDAFRGALNGAKLSIDPRQTLDGCIDPGERIEHGDELTKRVLEIDFSHYKDPGQYEKYRRVHHGAHGQKPSIPMHDFLIEPIRQLTKSARLHFIHAESLYHFEADKRLLVGCRDFRNGVLNPGGMLFHFSPEKSYEHDDHRTY